MKKMENLKDVIQRTKSWTKEKKYKHVPYYGYFGTCFDRIQEERRDDSEQFLITEELVQNKPYSIHLWLYGVEIGEVMSDQIILKEGPNTFGLKNTFRSLVQLGLGKWGKLESDSISPEEIKFLKDLQNCEEFKIWINPSLKEESYKGEGYLEPLSEGEVAFRVTATNPVSYYGYSRQKDTIDPEGTIPVEKVSDPAEKQPARVIEDCSPRPEKALEKVSEAVMHANAAIARYESWATCLECSKEVQWEDTIYAHKDDGTSGRLCMDCTRGRI